MGQAISGPQAGKQLKQTVMSHTSWQDWHQRFPDTMVLSTETGYKRDYSRSPYLDYAGSNKVWFSVAASDERYHAKEWVLGVTVNGIHKAYPFSELNRSGEVIMDKLDTIEIQIRFDQQHQNARVHDAEGNEMVATMAYWFAWIAFHPDTQVYVAR